ncbi:MAG: protein nirF [Gammaproteobacteria bacterium]|nr:protein nirF [Gammaproteobacteria bacterium]
MLAFVVAVMAPLLLSACVVTPDVNDLGIVIERAKGSVLVVDIKQHKELARVGGLGDLSHASVVYSPDQRYAYVFGRDGGLTKIDMLRQGVVSRVLQAGNSIGGAISKDGRWVAASNYKPGGVRIFESETLKLVADIPATMANGSLSRVVGLVDAPGSRFIFTLFDGDEIWVADIRNPDKPRIRKFHNVGRQPYDALITPDGRYYIAGLFGEDGLALLDLDNLDNGVQRILAGYGKGERKLPVYKMPHLEGWAEAGNYLFVPAVGAHTVLVVDRSNWQEVARIPVHGQPVFVMASPDGRQVWVNFAYPRNDTVQVIDAETRKVVRELVPGKAVLHMAFQSQEKKIWISVRDEDRVDIYDTVSFQRLASIPADKPSGIFFTSRATKIGL